MLIWIQPDHCPARVREMIERDIQGAIEQGVDVTDHGEIVLDGRIVARFAELDGEIQARTNDGPSHEDLLGQQAEIAELHAMLDRRDQELAELRTRHDALVAQHAEIVEELRITRGALDALNAPHESSITDG